MITIVISGPRGSEKPRIAKLFYTALAQAGFVNVQIFTTNVDTAITTHMTLEDKP